MKRYAKIILLFIFINSFESKKVSSKKNALIMKRLIQHLQEQNASPKLLKQTR